MGSETSKLLRWIIPGWVAILAFSLFVISDLLTSPSPEMFHEVENLVNLILPTGQTTSALLLAAAGFPLGFIIYQLYFYIRWNSPFSMKGFYPPLVNGRLFELKEVTRDIPFEHLALVPEGSQHTRKDWWRFEWVSFDGFDGDHVTRWQYLESLITQIFKDLDSRKGGVSLFDRYRHLMEMMHVLGAAYIAVMVGYGTYIYFRMRILHESLVPMLVISFIVFVVINASLSSEENDHTEFKKWAREQYNKKLDGTKEDDDQKKRERKAPIWAFWITLMTAAIIFFLNPAISVNKANGIWDWNFLIRFLLFFLVGGYLLVRWKNEEGHLRLIIAFFITLLLILICTIIPTTSVNDLWGMSGPVLILMVSHLVLLKNRLSARDDLLNFERYYLLHYLCEIKHLGNSQRVRRTRYRPSVHNRHQRGNRLPRNEYFV